MHCKGTRYQDARFLIDVSVREEETRNLGLAAVDADELKTMIVERLEVDGRDTLVCTRK